MNPSFDHRMEVRTRSEAFVTLKTIGTDLQRSSMPLDQPSQAQDGKSMNPSFDNRMEVRARSEAFVSLKTIGTDLQTIFHAA